MKNILELIFILIILFFVWNSLKRIFFTTFYKFPQQPSNKTDNFNKNSAKPQEKHGLNWDAEDAEYEEIKEEEKIKR